MMSTDSSETQTDAFIRFLAAHRDERLKTLTPEECVEECVEEYRAYQAEIQRFVNDSQQSLDEAQRGEAEPLDIDALLARVEKRLADNGVVDCVSLD